MHQMFWRFLRHIETFLDQLGGVDTPIGRVLVSKHWAKLNKYMGEGGVNISASIRAPCTKYFWRLLRHIDTFQDNLGRVDTPVGRVPVPKPGQVEQIHRGGGGQYVSFYQGPIHQIF